MKRFTSIVDGNEAAAAVAYRLSEVIAIYPITPSSPMGEWSDQWNSEKKKNVWGAIPDVIEMQSEGGAAGALHGALQAGALGTTFTASQGLLLMIPNMYKIAGELTAAVIHVAARTVATHALSIFGDHSDVMATRATGFALLSSNSVQEASDLACIAHAATLEARVPFLHFFDGFRTSHEVNMIAPMSDDDLRAVVDDKFVRQHRERAMSPGPAHSARHSTKSRCVFSGARGVQPVLSRLPHNCARRDGSFREANRASIPPVRLLRSGGCRAAGDSDGIRGGRRGRSCGCSAKVRRKSGPVESAIVPAICGGNVPERNSKQREIDRGVGPHEGTGQPGRTAVPGCADCYMEHHAANGATSIPRIIGGRYGLSSKEFTPAMVKAVFDELKKSQPKNHFTVGIRDDVTHTSLEYDADFSTEDPRTVRALFYGLGSDGTVGANKNSIKIIGKGTDNFAQGYFVYDSKKAGAVTVSHLRFGTEPIRSTYLITKANFVACHQFQFMDRIDVLAAAEPGATLLLNAPFGPEEIWNSIPRQTQETIIRKKLRFLRDRWIYGSARSRHGKPHQYDYADLLLRH